jgi:hypothetical protein
VFGADVARQLQWYAPFRYSARCTRMWRSTWSRRSTRIAWEIAQAHRRRRDRSLAPAGARRAAAGGYALTWRLSAATDRDLRQHFVDAHDGSIVFDSSGLERRAAVGRAQGVLGDTKKINVSGASGRFIAQDRLLRGACRTGRLRR